MILRIYCIYTLRHHYGSNNNMSQWKKKKKRKDVVVSVSNSQAPFSWLSSFTPFSSLVLSGRSISVIADGVTYSSFPITSGVRPGFILFLTLLLFSFRDLLFPINKPIHSFAGHSTLILPNLTYFLLFDLHLGSSHRL